MSSLITLLVLGVLFPPIWGLFVHRALIVLWPPHRRQPVEWSNESSQGYEAEFLDYQI